MATVSEKCEDSLKRARKAPLTRLSPWLTSKHTDYIKSSEAPGLGYISSLGAHKTPVSLNAYGRHVFRGAIAAPFLAGAGLAKDVLDTPAWTTDGKADKVAAAILAWARSNGASHYCHWFHPLGAAGLRHGQSAQVQCFLFSPLFKLIRFKTR